MKYRSRGFSAPRYATRGYGRSSGSHKITTVDPKLLVHKAVAVNPEIFVSEHSFSDFGLNARLLANIETKGYKQPSPIQDRAILPVLEGKDVVGIASTGTGKTAAFLLPLLQRMIQKQTHRILIITPTRELAVQINEELRGYSQGLFLRSVLCIGGVNLGGQVSALRQNYQIVIGTPGRLKDLSERGSLDFYRFDTIVLDEVDRMLDMGFIRDIRAIISQLAPNRHSLFFSATLTNEVEQIINTFVKNPVTVKISPSKTSENVNQEIVKTEGRAKIDLLEEMLKQDAFAKVIVFGRTKWGVEKLAKMLRYKGFSVASIHGNKTQGQRQRALEQFKRNELQVLLATDVASRGLDIDNVTHVINYDLPQSYDDYIHRIGRTGRADRIGTAITFVD